MSPPTRSPSPSLAALEDLVSSLDGGPTLARTAERVYIPPSLRRPSPPILTTAALALRAVPPELLSYDGGARSYRQALRREKKRLKGSASAKNTTSPRKRPRRSSSTTTTTSASLGHGADSSDVSTEERQGAGEDDEDGDAIERAVRERSQRKWPLLDAPGQGSKPEDERDLHRPRDGWTLADEVLGLVQRLVKARRERRAGRELPAGRSEDGSPSGRENDSSSDEETSSGHSQSTESSSSSSSSSSNGSGSRRSSTSPSSSDVKGKSGRFEASSGPALDPHLDAEELATTSASQPILAALLVEAQKALYQLWEELAREGGRVRRRRSSKGGKGRAEDGPVRAEDRTPSRSRSGARGASQSGSRAGSSAPSTTDGETGVDEAAPEGQDDDGDEELGTTTTWRLNMDRDPNHSRPKDWNVVLGILARLPCVSTSTLRRTKERLEALYGPGGALAAAESSRKGSSDREDVEEGESSQSKAGRSATSDPQASSTRLEAALRSRKHQRTTLLDAAVLDVSHLVPRFPHPDGSLRSLHTAYPTLGLLGSVPPTRLESFGRRRGAAKAKDRSRRIQEIRRQAGRKERERMDRRRRAGKGGEEEEADDQEEQVGRGDCAVEVRSSGEEGERYLPRSDGRHEPELESAASEEEDDDDDALRQALLSRATPEGE